MPSLDAFGKLAAATIVFYVPILVITVTLVLRHGFKRDAGWIFLSIFSTIRILGGILLIAAQLTRPINISLYTGAYVLEAAGLSPLLLATLGFLRTIGKNSFSEGGRMTRIFRLLGTMATVALVLAIYAGTSSNGSGSTSTTLRHVSSILFAVLYFFLVAVHVMCWLHVDTLMKHRRFLLIGISSALPFLGIRVLYSVLSSFSGSFVPSTTSTAKSNSLSKFNIATGDWRIHLVMGLIMEFVVVVIYTTVGAMTPLQNDYHSNSPGSPSGNYPLQGQTEYFPQGQAAYAPKGDAAYAPRGHNGYVA
jgi:hypothetical protein